MKEPGPASMDGLQKKKRRVGNALSLDKFAKAGVSKYDKRKVLEKVQKDKLIKKSKLKRVKHKLEKEGILAPLVIEDKVAELEALDKDSQGEHAQQRLGGAPSTNGSQRQQQRPNESATAGLAPGSTQNEEHKAFKKRKGKDKPVQHKTSLQRLAEEVQAKKEQERLAREQARKERVERERRIAEAQKHRKQEKHDMFRRTAKGQPVMKYRMQKILDKLQA